MDQPDRLADVATAVTDGAAVDWDGLCADSPSADEVAVLRSLEIVARIAATYANLSPASASSGALQDPKAAWGPLRIVERIGSGTYADVYRAHDPRLDRPVALKLLRQRESAADGADAVIEEARLLARVRHPNIVTIFGADRIDGRVGIWMELIEGHTLAREVSERGPLAAADVSRVGRDLCSALAAVHRAGLIHRDVKAQNVLRDLEGRVWLTDFGTGREITHAEDVSDLAGTPLYAAPEVLAGRAASPASDIYSLGVLLHYLATGKFPVHGRSLRELRDRHTRGERTPVRTSRPELPDRLASAIDRATSEDASARFSSADAFESALAERLRPRHRAGRIMATAAGIILVGTATWLALRSPAGPQSSVICTECVDDDGSLSADARFLVRQDPDTGDLNLLDLVTRQARPIGVKGTGSITQQFAELPVLSPDARFVVYRWIDRDRKLNQLRVFDTQAGGQPRVLIDDPLADFEPQDWRHDEKAVLVMITHAGGASDLEWVPIDGGPATVLTSFAAGVGVRRRARVSPDGRYAAYTRRTVPTASNTFVFVFDLESRTETPVVTTADDNRAPVWSGTTRLLYMSDTAGRFDLWSVRVEGGHAADSPVLESHDIGDHIVPMGAASGAYYYVKVDAGLDLTFIASVNAGRADMSTIRTHFVGYQPIWSPDGDSIAFYRHKGAGKEADLIVRSVETGRERVLHTSASTLPLFWFSDGRTLLEQIGGDGKNRPALNHVDVSTGASARIGWDLPAGLTRSPEAALSHDGRTLYSVAHDASSRTGGWDRVIAIDLVTGAIRLVCALAGPPDTLPGSGGVAVALSPDPESSTIAIAAGNTRHGTRLVRVKTDGSGYRELYGPYRSDSPYQKIAWSKDGRSIFFSMTLPGVFAGKTWQVMGVDANTGLLTWPVTDAIAGSDQGATFDLSRNKSRLAIHPNPGASQKFNPAAGPHTELRRIFLSSRK